MWATHYYKCKQDFQIPGKFSPVPYFLLCRAIELELKSRHLHDKSQKEVRDEFWHDLQNAYDNLPDDQKVLSNAELNTLAAANEIYKGKGFEYFVPIHAAHGYSQFPALATLDSIAAKLIAGSPGG